MVYREAKILLLLCVSFVSCHKDAEVQSDLLVITSSECGCLVTFYKQVDTSFVTSVLLDCNVPGGCESRSNLPIGIYIVHADAVNKTYQSLFSKEYYAQSIFIDFWK